MNNSPKAFPHSPDSPSQSKTTSSKTNNIANKTALLVALALSASACSEPRTFNYTPTNYTPPRQYSANRVEHRLNRIEKVGNALQTYINRFGQDITTAMVESDLRALRSLVDGEAKCQTEAYTLERYVRESYTKKESLPKAKTALQDLKDCWNKN